MNSSPPEVPSSTRSFVGWFSIAFLCGIAASLAIRSRHQASRETGSTERQREIARLTAENRRLRSASGASDGEGGSPETSTSTTARFRAAAALARSGSMGKLTWSRGEDNNLSQELAELGGALELDASQIAALQQAGETAFTQMLAVTRERATVTRLSISSMGAFPTDEERRASSAQADPTIKRQMTARIQAFGTLGNGMDTIQIEFGDWPEIAEIRARMQSTFASIMGPDRYAVFEAAGASQMIDTFFSEVGLRPGFIQIAAQPGNTGRYDVRKIHSFIGTKNEATRSKTGSSLSSFGGAGSEEGGSVTTSTRTAVSRETMVKLLGPVAELLPSGF